MRRRSVYIAHVYDAMGDEEEVLTWLERAQEAREPMILATGSRWLPFTSVRDTARFRRILQELPIETERGG